MAKKRKSCKKVTQKPQQVHLSALSYERMNYNYLFPKVYGEQIDRLKIPTVEELRFIGIANIAMIRSYLRDEERKINQELMAVRRSIKLLRYAKAWKLRQTFCDWHGLGFANIPEEEEAKIDDSETWCRELSRRERRVFSCYFGRDVAAFCRSKNVLTCSSHQCEGCRQYKQCFGSQPFLEETCRLANPTMLRECQRYLRRIEKQRITQMEYIEKYQHNIAAALKHIVYKEQVPFTTGAGLISSIYSGTDVVGYDIKTSTCEHGRIVAFIPAKVSKAGSAFLLIKMNSGAEVKLPLNAEVRDKLYLSAGYARYLKDNLMYRSVWVNVMRTKYPGLPIASGARKVRD